MPSEVCHNVAVEPELQLLTGESLQLRTANSEVGARLDVSAQVFFGGERHQHAFFDVRVFNPYAPSNCKSTAVYRRHENEKRSYQQRVLEMEHGSFTPLVFSATGGMGPAARVSYGRLASLLAEKKSLPYHQVIWLRCLLNLSLLRSTVMCIVFSATGGMGPAARVSYGRLASLLAEKKSLPYHQVTWLRCLLNFSLLRSTVMCIRGARSTSNGPSRSAVRVNSLNLAACSHSDVRLSC